MLAEAIERRSDRCAHRQSNSAERLIHLGERTAARHITNLRFLFMSKEAEDGTTQKASLDGEEVEFEIKLSDQAMALGEGGTLPQPEPYLGATARRDGEVTWFGVVAEDAAYLIPVTEQFTDEELERLYLAARRR